jgi:uncharacterized membrane protein YqiK
VFGAAWGPLQQVISLAVGALLLVIGFIFLMISKFYVRPSANMAYVRTGFGGRRVVLDSGALVFPYLHTLVPVSLETMKLEVERKGPDALITRDNLRGGCESRVLHQGAARSGRDSERGALARR